MSGETIDFSQESTPESQPQNAVSPEFLVNLAEQFHAKRGLFVTIAMTYVKSLHDAQDVVSTSWIKIQKAAASYDPSRPFDAWACVIVSNAAKSFADQKYGLKRKVKGVREITFTDMSGTSPAAGKFELEAKPAENVTSSVTPELLLEVQLKVEAVLKEMDPKVQRMMERYLNGEAMTHIVEGTGLKEATGYVYTYRFRKKMMEAVSQDQDLLEKLNDTN